LGADPKAAQVRSLRNEVKILDELSRELLLEVGKQSDGLLTTASSSEPS